MSRPSGIIREHLPSFFLLTLGAVIAAFALEEFLVPFTILDGGIVGVSMIVNQLTALPLGILTIVLNLPFMFVGMKKLGRVFLVKALYSMLVFSLMLSVFEELPALTDRDILVVAFGGVILGIGVGLILKSGGCLDGTEIVALLISRKFDFSVGQIVLGFNVVIYAIAGVLFGPDRALYSLLTYFITSKIIDIVENGMEQAKAVMIITNEGKAIADAIYTNMGRTCTLMDGAGLISGKKTVLYCVITRIEISSIKKIIKDTDGSAFVTISDVSEIVGQHIKQKKKIESASHSN